MHTLRRKLRRRRKPVLCTLCLICLLATVVITGLRDILTWHFDPEEIISLTQAKAFDSLQKALQSQTDLSGRHSDYINQSVCEDPDRKFQWDTTAKYDFIGPFKYLKDFKNPCFVHKNETVKCVPYFYLVGAPKAGSSDLFHRITQHPQVQTGLDKEIRWFDRRRFGEALPDPKYETFDGYLEFFDRATHNITHSFTKVNDSRYHNSVIGDGGPTYYFSSYYWKQVPGNEGCSEPRVTTISHIHHLWPGAKLLLVLRNPVTRLHSSYLFNAITTGADGTPEQFHEWTMQTLDVWSNCLRENSFRYCLYDAHVDWDTKLWELHIGLYSRYILDLLKIFPRRQLMVIPLEDYSLHTKNWMRDIFKFLELEPLTDVQLEMISKIEPVNKNAEHVVKTMLETTKNLLERFYTPFNAELAAILQDTRFLWLNT